MSVVLQLSDTHFGTERPAVAEALLRMAHRERPDLLVLSGDVTQRARRHQFLAALRFLDATGVPHTLVLPGNHDIPLFNLLARLVSPYGNHRRFFGEDLEPEFESEDLLVVGVNTTWAARHTVGHVSPAQSARVADRLREGAPGQLRIVVTHQPVQVIRNKDEKNLLRGHREAVLSWAAAGADLVLGGHIHLPHVRPLGENHPGLRRPVWSVQAGTAVSRRVRDGIPNSVNLVRYCKEERPRCCTVERWDHDDAAGAFVLAEKHLLSLYDAAGEGGGA